ncbi:MAG TPA: hypothetical protein VKC60_02505 [Opitutaceae bacterium]|nr:hypothetical protein [Opitutaceae bacterium]
MGSSKTILLLAVFFSLCLATPSFAANRENSAQTKFRWQDLLPRSLQANPRINVNIVTEMTDEGKKLPVVSVDHPVYYIGHDGGYLEEGDIVAGERPPNAKMLSKTLQNALIQAGYRGADREHPPTIFILYRWGSFNAYHDSLNPNETIDDFQWKNLLARVALVGGIKFAVDFAQAMKMGRLESFRMRDEVSGSLLDESFGDLYFLIAAAYDIEAMKKRERKLLWKTKISTGSQGLAMDETLPLLVSRSAQYFGREMTGPVQLFTRLHKDKVEIGTATVQGYIDPSEPKSYPKR